jgi:hypothetical protein
MKKFTVVDVEQEDHMRGGEMTEVDPDTSDSNMELDNATDDAEEEDMDRDDSEEEQIDTDDVIVLSPNERMEVDVNEETDDEMEIETTPQQQTIIATLNEATARRAVNRFRLIDG